MPGQAHRSRRDQAGLDKHFTQRRHHRGLSRYGQRIEHREHRPDLLIPLRAGLFHHIEHGILQTQAILGVNLLGRPMPTSLVQLWVPRVELHLFYNTIVFIPMVIAMYYHLFPPAAP